MPTIAATVKLEQRLEANSSCAFHSLAFSTERRIDAGDRQPASARWKSGDTEKRFGLFAGGSIAIGGYRVRHIPGLVDLMWEVTLADQSGKSCCIEYNAATLRPNRMTIGAQQETSLLFLRFVEVGCIPWKWPLDDEQTSDDRSSGLGKATAKKCQSCAALPVREGLARSPLERSKEQTIPNDDV